MKQLHRKNQDHAGGREDAKKTALKATLPMAEGRLKRLLRRTALALSIAVAPAAMTAANTGCIKSYTLEQMDSGKPEDGGADAGRLDGSHLDSGPDARLDAVAGHDGSADGGLLDAEVDASPPVCTTHEESQPFWLLQLGNSGLLGGYRLTYKSQDGDNSVFDVSCESNEAMAAADEVFTLNESRAIPLSEGDMVLSIRITNVWLNAIQLEASVSNP